MQSGPIEGFLLHTAVGSNDFPGQPGKAVVGGVLGLCVSVLWLAAYEHVAASVDMRIARAREIEPEGWELLTGRPHSFSHGKEVAFDGEDEPMRVTGFARLGIRNAARLLIADHFDVRRFVRLHFRVGHFLLLGDLEDDCAVADRNRTLELTNRR